MAATSEVVRLPAPATAAAEKVLDTYELLENILLNLPVRDLLLSERVSTAFRDVIAKSKDINIALFRAPGGVNMTWTANKWLSDDSIVVGPPVLNPFTNRYLEKDALSTNFILPESLLRLSTKPAKHEPSVAKMYISQPPLSELTADHQVMRKQGPRVISDVKDAGGLKFKKLGERFLAAPIDPRNRFVFYKEKDSSCWIRDMSCQDRLIVLDDNVTGREVLQRLEARKPVGPARYITWLQRNMPPQDVEEIVKKINNIIECHEAARPRQLKVSSQLGVFERFNRCGWGVLDIKVAFDEPVLCEKIAGLAGVLRVERGKDSKT